MNYEELIKYIDHELQWLKYYSNRETKESLNLNSNLYNDLKSIGYTKRVISLDMRCSPTRLSSAIKIDEMTKLSDLFEVTDRRDNSNNIYTPLEIYWLLYKEERNWVISKINE